MSSSGLAMQSPVPPGGLHILAMRLQHEHEPLKDQNALVLLALLH